MIKSFATAGALLFIVMAIPGRAAGAAAPSGDSLWYYEIGGADPVMPVLGRINNTLQLGGSASLSLGYSCGKFDPETSVTNFLNGVKQGTEAMYNQLYQAAQAAIANLPLYVLQKAQPGLYDLFQNALLRAEEYVSLATKSCEQMEYEITQGIDPYREWITLSKGNDWKTVMGTGGLDVINAKDTVETNNGKNGLPWIGGNPRGGEGMPPIEAVGDVVQAGYNTLLNRSVTAAGTVTITPTTPQVARLWVTPGKAKDWVVSVVGDKLVTTCEGCAKKNLPGEGLLPKYEEERSAVVQNLVDLISGTIPLTLINLDQLSAQGLGVSEEVILALRKLDPEERTLFAQRIASGVALERTKERARAAQRMLATGRLVPEVQAVGAALNEVDRAIAELERETATLGQDVENRQSMLGDIMMALLLRDRARGVPQQPPAPLTSDHPFQGGAVR